MSNSKVVAGERFGMLMQPFNSAQQVEAVFVDERDKKGLQCKNCMANFNFQSEAVSLYDLRCKCCGQV